MSFRPLTGNIKILLTRKEIIMKKYVSFRPLTGNIKILSCACNPLEGRRSSGVSRRKPPPELLGRLKGSAYL